MSVLSVADFRTYGPGPAVSSVDDAVIQFWIDSAEKTASGLVGKRGYEDLIATAAEDFKGAIIAITTWNVMRLVRGVSPLDPAHDALKEAHKEGMAFFERVAEGRANLASPATRTTTGMAEVFSGSEETEDRGW